MSDLRASDADRERLIDELNEHAAEGRLTTDELEERVASAYAARTADELDALHRDLPMTVRRQTEQQRERRAHLTKRMLQESGGTFGAFAVCVVIWVASGAHGQFWPVWVLLVCVLTLVRNGWALFGPGADLDAVEASLEAHREKRLDQRDRHADRHADRRDRRLGR